MSIKDEGWEHNRATGTITATITVRRYANGELEVNGLPSRRDGKFICHLAEVGEEFLLASQGTERQWKKARARTAIEASAVWQAT